MVMPLDELEKRIFCYLPIGSNMMVNSKEICRTFDIKDPKTLRDIIHGMVNPTKQINRKNQQIKRQKEQASKPRKSAISK
ncbi:TPA: hypothetical protein ACH2M7_001698 [Streptococcus pyogenes]